jgi:hypothetical protein
VSSDGGDGWREVPLERDRPERIVALAADGR